MKSFFFLFLALLVMVSAANSQDIAKNKQEGEVVWYTNIPRGDVQELADAFERVYPHLKMKSFVAEAGFLVERLTIEMKSNKHLSDIIELPADKVPALKDNDLIELYCSPESKLYRPEHKDRDCYWTDAGASYKVPAYNTQQITGNSIPKDWGDFLDPRWKNQISLPVSNMLIIYPGFIQRWGREKARKYLTRLVENGVVWEVRGQSILPKLVAGEISLTSVSHNLIEAQKKKGAPVDWVNTARPIVSQMQVVSLSRKAPNREAARLFIDFLLSKKGQEIKMQQARISGRSDMSCPLKKVDCRKLDVLVVQPPRSLADFLEIQNELRKIIRQ